MLIQSQSGLIINTNAIKEIGAVVYSVDDKKCYDVIAFGAGLIKGVYVDENRYLLQHATERDADCCMSRIKEALLNNERTLQVQGLGHLRPRGPRPRGGRTAEVINV